MAHYKFDNSLSNDVTGANNFTLANGATVSQRNRRIGRAQSFRSVPAQVPNGGVFNGSTWAANGNSMLQASALRSHSHWPLVEPNSDSACAGAVDEQHADPGDAEADVGVLDQVPR